MILINAFCHFLSIFTKNGGGSPPPPVLSSPGRTLPSPFTCGVPLVDRGCNKGEFGVFWGGVLGGVLGGCFGGVFWGVFRGCFSGVGVFEYPFIKWC